MDARTELVPKHEAQQIDWNDVFFDEFINIFSVYPKLWEAACHSGSGVVFAGALEIYAIYTALLPVTLTFGISSAGFFSGHGRKYLTETKEIGAASSCISTLSDEQTISLVDIILKTEPYSSKSKQLKLSLEVTKSDIKNIINTIRNTFIEQEESNCKSNALSSIHGLETQGFFSINPSQVEAYVKEKTLLAEKNFEVQAKPAIEIIRQQQKRLLNDYLNDPSNAGKKTQHLILETLKSFTKSEEHKDVNPLGFSRS